MRIRPMNGAIVSTIAAVLVMVVSAAQAQAPKPLTVRLGWQPLAGGSAAIAMVMQRDKLFEQAAERHGYNLTIEWKTFAAGPPSNEAMVAGHLDLDMHLSALPTANRIAAGIPALPFAVVGSNIANAILVKPGSSINDVSKLAGKTVGAPIGTSAHYVLASIVRAHFDKNLEEAGIRIINMPVTEGVKVPPGVDAAAVWVPLRFIGPQQGLSELLVDANGWTGKGSTQPGTRLPEVKNAWAYPEGYATDRLYAFARTPFHDDHPNVLVAFLEAHIEAQERVLAQFEDVVKLANDRWAQPDIIARTTLQTYAETAGVRRAPYMLEWDVASVRKASEFLTATKVRDKPLSWEELKSAFAKTAAVQKRVWEARKQMPTLDEMSAGFTGKSELYGPIHINGGAPVWAWDQTAKWGERVVTK